MISLKRTNSEDPDFIELVKKLDTELATIDGPEHAFYAQYNKIDLIKQVVVCYNDSIAVACGAIKPFEASAMEVKRMYCNPDVRSNGIATRILNELEKWAIELGYNRCVLETGKRQQDAVALYSKNGYNIIPNYGQYVGIDNSLCFEKLIG